METRRLKYIDGIKGFAILFVVFYHLIWCCVKDKDSAIVPVFNSVCMQLFFFVSGYVSCKGISKMVTIKDVCNNIAKKGKALLIPSILMFSFCIWYFHQDLYGELLYEFKAGYWFAYVLFFIFLLHYIVVMTLKLIVLFCGVRKFLLPLVLLLAFLASCHCWSLYRICEYFRILSLAFILKYYFFFLVGYLFSRYADRVNHILNLSYTRYLIFILSFLFLLLPLTSTPYFAALISLSQVVFVLCFFKDWEEQSRNSWLLNRLAYIGRHSMEIYFIHYYFMFGLPQLHDFIESQDVLYIVRGPGSKAFVELLTLLPISILLVYFSIFVRKLFDLAPQISTYLFGPIPR